MQKLPELACKRCGHHWHPRENKLPLQCPHCHFHSDKGFQGRKYNGDANGAYNIARKGLLALRKIQVATDPAKIKWGDLKVSIDEWDKFTQIKWNPTFKSQK